MIIEIKTHDGLTYLENMETYDEVAISEQLNDDTSGKQMVVLGKTIISKHTIRIIRPAENQEVAPVS